MKRVVLLLVAALGACARSERPALKVASKSFTESVVLGELVVKLARDAGVPVEHRRALGGTRLVWNALLAGEVDVYPEYTGTLAEEILRVPGRPPLDAAGLGAALAERGLEMSAPLGFNNTYAFGMREEVAERLGVRRMSDLAAHPKLRFGLSNEFMNRRDGWPAVQARYQLPHAVVQGVDHDVAYRGLAAGSIDVIDLYSTDAEIAHYRLRVLADDRALFPRYDAVLVHRRDAGQRWPAAFAALRRLPGAIDAATMVALNGQVKLRKQSESAVASAFLEAKGLSAAAAPTGDQSPGRARRILQRGREHLELVAVSLLAAVLIAVPLGIAAARRPRLGQLVLAAVGVIQTVPSLALLVFMVPLLGIGALPATVALFLYSLLPIVRNTHAGLAGIPPQVRESAEALGLPSRAILRLVELPLASRSILAGIKSAAVINVGTATLGALVGAGGFGQPIFTGVRLDDVALILEGAIPASLLALAVQGLFELVERLVVPRGLRLRRE
jgi:osmoprotectant transport system permease protein